jgi:hypothetical protein
MHETFHAPTPLEPIKQSIHILVQDIPSSNLQACPHEPKGGNPMKSAESIVSLAYPALTPAIYSKLHAEVNSACDEMIQMNTQGLNPQLLGQMSSRVYENVKKAYPEVEKYARAYDKTVPQASAEMMSLYGAETQSGGGFLGLIGFLLLVGFFGRRGIRRGRRF